VPEAWPTVNDDQLKSLLSGDYADIASRVLTLFGGDSLPQNMVHDAMHNAMDHFTKPVGPPVTNLKAGLWKLELMHGPTLAFKDFALAPLAELIAQMLQHENRQATVLCATSGDTGAATVSAFANRHNLHAVVLFPDGGVSEFQRKQMTTTGASNVLPLCVKADFDTCQSIVKSLYQTPEAKQHGYTAVNSINIVRILLQCAYYFRTSGLINAQTGKPSRFIVPTGNFGNVYAAFIAKQLGAPIEKLIVTSNDNDVLPRLFETSTMQGKKTVKTISPSMDIQISSNFERLLWHIKSQNGTAVETTQQSLTSTGTYQLSKDEMDFLTTDFQAVRCTETQANSAMQYMQSEYNATICPHTATAVNAMLEAGLDTSVETVMVETAHPAKFSDAVKHATGVTPKTPAQAATLMQSDESYETVDADISAVQQVISQFFS